MAASSSATLLDIIIFGAAQARTHRHLKGVRIGQGWDTCAGTRGIDAPAEKRTHLRKFAESGVEHVAFIQQGGRYRHEHVCEALELFAS